MDVAIFEVERVRAADAAAEPEDVAAPVAAPAADPAGEPTRAALSRT